MEVEKNLMEEKERRLVLQKHREKGASQVLPSGSSSAFQLNSKSSQSPSSGQEGGNIGLY